MSENLLQDYFSEEITDRLQQVYRQLREEGFPITGRLLARRAQVGRGRASAYLRGMTRDEQSDDPTPEERLRRAYAHLAAKGSPVRVPDLCREAGVNGKVAGVFLRAHQHRSLEQLEAASVHLLARGEQPSISRLYRETHLSERFIRSYLRERRAEQQTQDVTALYQSSCSVGE